MEGPAGQRIDSFTQRAIHLTVDVGYYAPAARTTQKPECSCVLAPKLDRPNRLALSRVLPSGIRRVCSATRLWVPPKGHDSVCYGIYATTRDSVIDS